MSVTFLHTADWQLGKPYQRVADSAKRGLLQHERLACLKRLATLARERQAAFVLVAGDLFDSPGPLNATVAAACEAIGAMEIPVLAIPGNHDHGGPGSLWRQPFFLNLRDQLAPNLQVLLAPQPLVLEHAVILPAPLLRRHDHADPSAWIRGALDNGDLHADRPRIVLAHGSVQGFEAAQDDEDEQDAGLNRIDLTRLPDGEIDYIALGDWHGTKQVGIKSWYAGTPEIDRFPRGADNDPGNVLIVQAGRGTLPVVEKIATGRLRWAAFDHRFADDAAFDAFRAEIDAHLGQWGQECLLKLTLGGSLGIETSRKLEEWLAELDARLLRLKLDCRVAIAPTPEEIQALASRPGDPLIATVAARLIAMTDGPDAETARLALRELHTAIR